MNRSFIAEEQRLFTSANIERYQKIGTKLFQNRLGNLFLATRPQPKATCQR